MGRSRLPLEGVRVLDLTLVVAGPYCTMLLADWGAEVIRLEPLKVFAPLSRGAVARPSKAFVEGAGAAGYGYASNDPGERPWNKYVVFQNHARNKLSMTVDLRTAEGKRAFEQLLAVSDVLVENNVPETLEKLGVSWEAIRRVRPDFILVRLPSYGLQGPYKNYRAFGSHIEAVTGHYWVRGYPDTELAQRGLLPVADGPSGLGGALAVVMALRHRARTGQGQVIELSQTEHFATYLGEALMDASMNGRDQQPLGNRHPVFAPYGCYPCQGGDRWVAITISSEEEWSAFCRALGDPAWASDSRFATHEGRHRHHDELDQHIATWTRQHDHYAVMNLLQGAGVPAGAVIDEAEASRDPHLLARGFFERLTHADCGTHVYPGLGFRLRNTPNSLRTPPCRLGEHNERVYKDLLGVSEEEYLALERQGLIGMDYAPEVV